MQIIPIAWTHFDAETVKNLVPWETDADGGQALAEFAGRACYQSWRKPNPATATNQGYLKHILDVGHYSVLEHGVVTFYVTGVSRALTHELIRHRHLSYSQLSQRYVDSAQTEMIEPDIIAEDPELHEKFVAATTEARQFYRYFVRSLDEKFTNNLEMSKTQKRKLARQAARAVLPNAAETKIVVTGNYRAWLEFIPKRHSPEADVEIQAFAGGVAQALRKLAPNVFDTKESE